MELYAKLLTSLIIKMIVLRRVNEMEEHMKKDYTIVLVDDEEEVRKRIISKIPTDMGFEIIGQASNGYDAIDLIERLKPDVVITDIRMPFVDGIQLANIIRTEHPKTKIAFISGYDEFAYAKEAIELDVVSYLSKPITEEEIVHFLNKLKNRLDEEYQAVFNQGRLDDIYKENLPALIENQFNTLLHYSSINDSDLQRFKIFDIDLTKGYFTVGIIEIDSDSDFLEIEYLRIFLLNLLKKKFSEYKIYYINSGFGLIFVIHQDTDDVKVIETRLYDVILTKKQFSNIRVLIGVSETFNDFKLFSNSVLQAKKALSYSNYLNIGTIIYYKDIATRKRVDLKLTKEEIDDISYTIKFGSKQEVDTLFANLIKNNDISEDYLLNKQYYLVNLAHIFIEFANSLHVELSDLVETDLFEKLSSFTQLSSMFEYLKKLVFDIRELNIHKSQTSANQVLEEAVLFLQNNYADPLMSMDTVCDELGISISYLSTLFKKMLDTSFNKYLVKLRMEKAKELLKFSHAKIYEIATLVGYNDVYYFSYSFKKYTGTSPKEYRYDQKVD